MTDTGWTEDAISETNSIMYVLSHVLSDAFLKTVVNCDLRNEFEAWREVCQHKGPTWMCSANIRAFNSVVVPVPWVCVVDG